MMSSPSPVLRTICVGGSPGTEELGLLEDLMRPRRIIRARTSFPGDPATSRDVYFLHDGWAVSYRLVEDGGRQIIDVAIPGDVLSYQSFSSAWHGPVFEAVTDVEVTAVPAHRLANLAGRMPRLSATLNWAEAREQEIIIEHLVGLGRRNAEARTAHFFLELRQRLMDADSGSPGGFPCPLTQTTIADALGLTPVHLSRVLKSLRQAGLLDIHGGRVRFCDIEALSRLAGFEAGYLARPDQTGSVIRL